jgi:hypothetical protein
MIDLLVDGVYFLGVSFSLASNGTSSLKTIRRPQFIGSSTTDPLKQK